ncbi:hypothetical protein GH5_07302 [Leishmania sp. Ghana 2012 LV757]|uniref:hypothetical protein n=1 Tax=Leishmania sp. Ghana 2012 LV757 TaxID=2803181 RepID=UPI001B62B7A8|nr:hypothetical protein GH5_07302 [Leishmania sp. Ghana 2012 LV757]
MQRTAPAVTASSSPPKTAQVPKEPTITIISSDGETFSMSPSTIAHSHLLEGAVRKWAEVYQENVKGQASACRSAISALGTPRDAHDDDDATADELEETPDEICMSRFYEETASDVTATSGALEEVNSCGGTGVAASALGRGAVDDDATSRLQQERLRVTRTRSMPTHDEEGTHRAKGATPPFVFAHVHQATDVAREAAGDAENLARGALDRDTDSDRTASVLSSSAEGSMSNKSSPYKSQSNGSTPTRVTDVAGIAGEPAGVPRPAHPFRSDTFAGSSPLPTSIASSRHSAVVGRATARSGSVCSTLPGPGTDASMATATTRECRNSRSPAAARISPAGRSSHLSPSSLMDNDQSTPSVLSGEEGEEGEEPNSGEGATYADGVKRSSRDSRNLGDEGLDDVAATSSLSPDLAVATAAASNGRGARHHRDPGVVSSVSALASHTTSSSPPLTSCAGGRRRSSTVVQAGAAEADDGFDENAKGGAGKEEVGVASNTAAAATRTSTGSARSSSGRHSTSPPLSWHSPGSCHQRTPCMADEDDVGAMMSEDRIPADGGTPTGLLSSRTGSVGGSSPPSKPPLAHSAGGAATTSVPSPTDRTSMGSAALSTVSAGVAAVSDLVKPRNGAGAAASASPLASSLVYADGIRITPSAIVFDLVQSVSSSASPSSGKGAAAVPVAKPAASTAVAPPAVASSIVNIRSSTLLVCIKYMKHFAEAEAQAAAKATAAGKRRRHRRGRHGSSNCEDEGKNDSSATGTSSSSSVATTRSSSGGSDKEGDDAEKVSTVSDSSFRPTGVGSPPESPRMSGTAAGKGSLVGTAHGAAPASSVSPPGGPAVIPAPLTMPLVALLSPWEKKFLYADVLGAPEMVLAASLAILDVCPGFDYESPSVHLGDAKVKAALLTPPPPREGVHALMEVMAAAKQLQIGPLHALCAGWLADFVIRVSYGASDNFEAAHLIRQCLRVPSDWSRRETDCLKIENEWPANEDAE